MIADVLAIAALLAIILVVHWHGIRETRRQAIADARTRRLERMPELYGTARWADCGCSAWDARGDRPVAVWCRDHCPDCDSFCPCVIHDQALWAREWQRRLALPDPQRRTS